MRPGIYSTGQIEPPKVKLKAVFCWPTREFPHKRFAESIEMSVPLIEAAGFDVGFAFERGNPYISGARATLLKKAINAKADMIIFLDDDVSWKPGDLLKLVEAEGEVVGGTYRAKEDDLNYMGRIIQDANGKPTSMRDDRCLECACLPAGFLKVTKEAIEKFMRGYPELCYGPPWDQAVDFMNHGAHKGLWWGEDYAFCRRFRDIGGKVWLIPDLYIDHNDWKSERVYRGNFHHYLLRQPGGALEGQPYPAETGV